MSTTPSPLRLLIVEDDPADQLLLEEALNAVDCGLEVRMANGGREALDLLDRDPAFTPDLIVTDLNMPRVSGFELLQALKRDERWRRIPVIVLSTSSHPQDIRRSYDLWASSYIQKPVAFEQYQQVLEGFCRYWSERAQLPTHSHPRQTE